MDKTKWTSDTDMVDLEYEAQQIIHDIGDCKREWQSIAVETIGGPEEVVALCHPCNAKLISKAPGLLDELTNIAGELKLLALQSGRYGEYNSTINRATKLIKAAGGIKKYAVTIKAEIVKDEIVEAVDIVDAEDLAHDQFSVLHTGSFEVYTQDTLNVREIS